MSIRHQIIQFNPGPPDSVCISHFCKQLGISNPSYYAVKERCVAEGNKALDAHSQAPKTSRAVYGDETKQIVLLISKRLTKDGGTTGYSRSGLEPWLSRNSVTCSARVHHRPSLGSGRSHENKS